LQPPGSLADADLQRDPRTPGLSLGLSTHDDGPKSKKTALRTKPDYIALCPIFPTTLEIDAVRPPGHPRRSPNGRCASARSRMVAERRLKLETKAPARYF